MSKQKVRRKEAFLPLTKETMTLLEQKHPDAKSLSDDMLLYGLKLRIHPVAYESIDSNMIYRASLHVKGGSGPSGLAADGWRGILTSRVYVSVFFRMSQNVFSRILKITFF